MLTLVLVRHGETALNAEGRYQGRIDPPLSARGVEQGRGVGEVLGGALSDAATAQGARVARGGGSARVATGPEAAPAVTVHASDRRRALSTAALACPGAPIHPEPRLRELDFGAFDGLTCHENLEAHGDLFRCWLDAPARVRPPGGETLPELEVRIADWLDTLPRRGCLVAFTHGGPIHAILARLLRIPFLAARRHPLGPGEALRVIVAPGQKRLVAPPVRLQDLATARARGQQAHTAPPVGPQPDRARPTVAQPGTDL